MVEVDRELDEEQGTAAVVVPKRRGGAVVLSDEAIQRIQRAMDVRHWSQMELARQAGISSATVNLLLNTHRASPRSLRKIADAFENVRMDRRLADLIEGRIE